MLGLIVPDDAAPQLVIWTIFRHRNGFGPRMTPPHGPCERRSRSSFRDRERCRDASGAWMDRFGVVYACREPGPGAREVVSREYQRQRWIRSVNHAASAGTLVSSGPVLLLKCFTSSTMGLVFGGLMRPNSIGRGILILVSLW